ncbi:hypothetical protein C8J56DRAFT_1056310 [Mycena floridula]|nr:hypothetical protein C8J56DRAFT_1056310 [Mycena floridula]
MSVILPFILPRPLIRHVHHYSACHQPLRGHALEYGASEVANWTSSDSTNLARLSIGAGHRDLPMVLDMVESRVQAQSLALKEVKSFEKRGISLSRSKLD